MTLRIADSITRPTAVTIQVDGQHVTAYPGEMLAAALFAVGIRVLRHSPRERQPRGMFCLMGVCQECLLRVDGRRALACQVMVRADMAVTTGLDY